jgi:hypothetical protein
MSNLTVLIVTLLIIGGIVGLNNRLSYEKLHDCKEIVSGKDYIRAYYRDIIFELIVSFILIGISLWSINFILTWVYDLIRAGWL